MTEIKQKLNIFSKSWSNGRNFTHDHALKNLRKIKGTP